MQAKAWWGGSRERPTYGIRVGSKNRDSYFKAAWETIEVELDGKIHEFKITKGFWNKCPEFRDQHGAIRDWLRRHKSLKWSRGNPPAVQLLPIGSRTFRLIP